MAVTAGREYIQSVLNMLVKDGGFDSILKTVKILSAGNGNLSAVMTVGKEHENRGACLHGGMTSTIVDQLSSLALMTYPNVKTAGVSIALNVSFMRTIPTGTEILIKASTDKVGSTIAFLTVDILNRKGQLVAKGTHTKYIGSR